MKSIKEVIKDIEHIPKCPQSGEYYVLPNKIFVWHVYEPLSQNFGKIQK